MKGNSRFFKIFILGLLSAIGPFSIDMYLPGFTNIASDLNTDVSKVSLTLSSFFIGISVGQLLYGPLLDKYGRKKPLYFGLCLYLFASLGCAYATSVQYLIVLRFLQALGGCAGMVASRAMVRDMFDVEDNAKVFSLLMLVIGVSPIIAPSLGGFVTASLGWRYVFGVLLLIGLFILVLCVFKLPESKQPAKDYSLAPRFILGKFSEVFREPQFVIYTFASAFTAAGLYAYVAGSPHVFMEVFKVSEKTYGWIFSIIAASLVLATQINARILKFTTSEKIIPKAVLVQTIAGVLLFVGFIYNWWGLTTTIILCSVFLACQGFTFPNASALALAPFDQNAGSASALIGCVQMAVGTLSSAMVSVFHNNTSVPLGLVMGLCAATALSILISGKYIVQYKARKSEVEKSGIDMLSEM
ncbi:MAG TPA: multidrug effflux MFS transporter [Niabella sp.]|nr:multidrug effflux MFS transporter [Niabella sp.]HOZ96723.1 multidrug effflux MFS transporter [Niabella sp.]HQW16443.1 multidrug effflux MFS transporter [Niabella sp.]HQX19344.1 multidrug effflux MFS transporter [Niabella sp.]HQX42827.1 multidrug effflux MFS transporter [Niabella sp.]